MLTGGLRTPPNITASKGLNMRNLLQYALIENHKYD